MALPWDSAQHLAAAKSTGRPGRFTGRVIDPTVPGAENGAMASLRGRRTGTGMASAALLLCLAVLTALAACGGEQAAPVADTPVCTAATALPQPTPTPLPTATALSTAIPESTPTIPPAVTSQIANWLRTVELDPEYRPVYVFDREYAAIGPDNEIYLVNIETGEINKVADDGCPQCQAAFSEHYVAWANRSDDIFVLDRATSEQRRITDVPARRVGFEISGHWLVWMDRRNESGQHYADFDIYGYNMKTGEEILVAIAPGSQRSPSIHGNTVVWADNRNSPLAGARNQGLPDPGCFNCPENRSDIHALDLTTGEERVLVETGYYNEAPEIYGTYLAWRAYDPEHLPELRLLDLESGHVQTIAEAGNFWSGPSLSEEYLVWSTSWPCDVGPRGDLDTGVFAQHLETGETWKLTDYVEPWAVISGRMVIITERCQVGGREYAVFLE